MDLIGCHGHDPDDSDDIVTGRATWGRGAKTAGVQRSGHVSVMWMDGTDASLVNDLFTLLLDCL